MAKPKIRFKGYTDDWEQRKLSDVVDSVDTGKSKFDKEGSSGEYPILGSTSVIGYDDEYDYEGDFILTARVGANAGSLYRHAGKVKISDNTVFIQASQNIEFLYQLLTRFDIKKLSFGTGQPLVKASELKSLELMMPTNMKEQMRIGAYFNQLDHLITLHQRKCEETKKLKKYMLQKMFPQNGQTVPEIRFAGFTDAWEQRKLRNLVDRVTRKNQDLVSELPLTISAQYGLIDQNEFFDKRVASKDVSGYYLIENGEFAYNRSTSTDAPWGAIKRLDRYENGVLSTLYIVFRIKENNPVDSDFLVSYYSTNLWHKGIHEIAAEGARNHGLLNIAPADFFETELRIPQDIEEQKKIGKYFEKLERLITLHQCKCHLLLKLLHNDWEQRKFPEFVSFFNGLTYTPDDVQEMGTLVLRSSNVKNGEIIDADNVYVNDKVATSENVQVGDIIVVVRNGSRALIGKHAQIKASMPNTVIGAFMNGIRSEHSSFVNALLDTSAFENEIAKNMGATINQITGYMFSKMEFMVPSEEEQQQIGQFFSNLDHLITLHHRKYTDTLKSP